MNKLKITSLSVSGEGIGSLDGLKVFVDGALPEEDIEFDLTANKRNYAVGKLKTILNKSPDRVQPPCPYFNACGGCQLMHLSYPAQLEVKKKRVRDALERIGGFKNPPIDACVPSPFSLHYRNKIQLPIVWKNGEKHIGLFRKNSHEVIPIDACLIQSAFGEEVFSFVKKHLKMPSVRYLLIRTAEQTREAIIVFVTDGTHTAELKKLGHFLVAHMPTIKCVVENIHPGSDNVILGKTFRMLAGHACIHETILGKIFKISPASFFQVNPLQAENLYTRAIELAELNKNHVVVDAFCGVGTLALLAAASCGYVHGIETVPQAILDARENARLNQITHASFHVGKAEELVAKLGNFDSIFLNPPRKGCQKELIDTLLMQGPKKIIYISCDPATLARDLSLLTDYQLTYVQPFDMFPQTMHVETLAVLTRP